MARIVIQTRDGDRSFFVADGGGVLRLERGRNHGTLGQQLCENGGYRGKAITCTPETLEAKATKWLRQNMGDDFAS